MWHSWLWFYLPWAVIIRWGIYISEAWNVTLYTLSRTWITIILWCIAFNFKNSNIYVSFLLLWKVWFPSVHRFCVIEHPLRHMMKFQLHLKFFHNEMALVSHNKINKQTMLEWHFSFHMIYICGSSHIHILLSNENT